MYVCVVRLSECAYVYVGYEFEFGGGCSWFVLVVGAVAWVALVWAVCVWQVNGLALGIDWVGCACVKRSISENLSAVCSCVLGMALDVCVC